MARHSPSHGPARRRAGRRRRCRGRLPLALAGALAALLLLLPACGDDAAELEEPRHLFLITVDTLRADHLSLYGYPRQTSRFIDELAAGGVVFDRAIAQWPATGSSFASIFTGLYPQTTGLTQGAAVRLPGEYVTLAELLSAAGFTTAAVVSNPMLRDSMGWDQGFDEYLQTWDLAPVEPEDPVEFRQWVTALRVNQLALPLLDRLRHEERLFVWLHYSDPHAPYYLPEGTPNPFLGDPWDVGEEPAKIRPPIRAKALGDNRDLSYYIAHYDANIHLADDHIGEALDRARGLGLLEDALILFTSDHGESLGEHDYYFGHGRLPYNTGSHVPLVIQRTSGGAQRRVAPPVELVDLFPTLRSLLAGDLEIGGLEGKSLAPLLGDEQAAEGALSTLGPAFSQAGGTGPRHQYRSIQEERWKLILRPARGGPRPREARWQLFRLDRDPGERRDLSKIEVDEVGRLRRELEEWMLSGEGGADRPAEAEAHSEETLKALKALGYID